MSNRLEIMFVDENDRKGIGALDKLPGICPQCKHKIDPQKGAGFYNSKKLFTDSALEIVFRCPNLDCHEVFLGYYAKDSRGNSFFLRRTDPTQYEERVFSQIVTSISNDFACIYNQSLAAENAKLDQVCGAGYRKCLEFLLKDYLLKQTDDAEEKKKIKNESLAKSINDRIKDTNIKEVAKRATWLGNDEVHYTRKWDHQDLQDLKKLIDLTIHWMEAEALTSNLLQSMPDKQAQK